MRSRVTSYQEFKYLQALRLLSEKYLRATSQHFRPSADDSTDAEQDIVIVGSNILYASGISIG